MDWLIDASAWVLPVVLAITLHEAAHGYVALKFGDDTALRMGRVTFNPIKHIDRFGTIVLPALLLLAKSPILFGYAKPVPVNFHQMQPPRLGMFAVAVAGVCMNFALALAAAILLKVVAPEQGSWLFNSFIYAMLINCVLIIFNMLPILPLDGGRVVDAFLTGEARRQFRKMERFGIPLVFLALLIPPFLGYNVAQTVIGAPTFWLVEQLLWLTGNTL